MKQLSDEKIVESWGKNAHPWAEAIRNDEITSRVQTTNQAIFEAVTLSFPKTVLDIGCGEGWLVRRLANSGIDVLGIDVVSELIDYARKEGDGRYKVLSYEDISSEALDEKYDVIVCNFSLLGKESVNHVFQQIPLILEKKGSFIVQTIHPTVGCESGEYVDGWREGTWSGFSERFSNPAPWYFRTLETWKMLFNENGFILKPIIEPMNKIKKTADSILFVANLDN